MDITAYAMQGMNELLAPLFYVVMHDPDPSLSEGTSRKACYASLCVRVFKRGTGAPAFCR